MVVMVVMVVVVMMMTVRVAAGIACGDEPEEAPSARATELLGVLPPVDAQRAGFVHLAHAGVTGVLVAQDGAAKLRDPAVDGRDLVPMVAVTALRFAQRT